VPFNNAAAIQEPFQIVLVVIAEETGLRGTWVSDHVIEAQSSFEHRYFGAANMFIRLVLGMKMDKGK
jgi:hypothetical protein